MIDAEKWYEYQTQYQKYGLDMKPERVRPQRRRKRYVINPNVKTRAKSRKLAFSGVAAIGILCIFVIMVTAYCANLRYDINEMMKQNNAVMGEIENLEAKLYSANNIGVVESTASKDMKMTYPSKKKQIYVSRADVPSEGFSAVLREKAY